MARFTAELSSAFTKGLQLTFNRTYAIAVKAQNPRLPQIATLGLPSDGQSEIYHHWQAAATLGRWRTETGEAIPEKGFSGVQWEVANLEFGRRIPFKANALADDRTRSAMDVARDLALDAPKKVERCVWQVYKNSTDTDGLDSIPNAPDGNALHYATGADGNARFGATGGNLLTGTGTTAKDYRDGYYAAIERWGAMTDPEGRELLSEDVRDAGVIILHPVGVTQVMEEAFIQRQGVTIVQNVAGTENVGGASVTNLILDSGRKIILWGTQFLTGNSIYFNLLAAPKPVFVQDREPLSTETQDLTNSDHAKTHKEVSFQAHCRFGVGVAPPFGTIKYSQS